MSETVPVQSSSLMGSRRFLPLFITQFTGAFNDNFYKSALLVLFTYGGLERWGLDVNVINNLVSATMIIPFLLFAGLAGQLADKYEKSRMIRQIKLAEILIMIAGAISVINQSSLGLLLVLFMTGTQSACFSPLKYSVVPQLVSSAELTSANGLMHMGTNLAMFGGLMLGTALITLPIGPWLVAGGGVLLALCGWWASQSIPVAHSKIPELEIGWHPWRHICGALRAARSEPMVFTAILGVSWYWFLGSVYLTQLPNLTRTVLHAQPIIVALLLFLFLLGICLGAISCARLSRQAVEPAVAVLGGLGVFILGVDLYFAGQALPTPDLSSDLLSVSEFLGRISHWRILFDVTLLGVSGGLYFVPLLGLMQSRCLDQERSRVLGANNIMNAIFMVLAALLGVFVLGVMEWSITQLFGLVAILHGAMMLYLMRRQPEFWQRFRVRFTRVAKF